MYKSKLLSASKLMYMIFILGEGVDDHGGPYRAAFHTAVGEEPAGLLGLLSPSMNSKTGTGIPFKSTADTYHLPFICSHFY
jgi:hypothetical protein